MNRRMFFSEPDLFLDWLIFLVLDILITDAFKESGTESESIFVYFISINHTVRSPHKPHSLVSCTDVFLDKLL